MTKNITLSIDEAVLEKVRVYAAQRKTTVNAMVRDFLAKTADEDHRLLETRRKLKRLMENSTMELGPDYVWNREEIYADRMLPRHQRPDLRRSRKKG
jgi:hypothetical protein